MLAVRPNQILKQRYVVSGLWLIWWLIIAASSQRNQLLCRPFKLKTINY